MKTEEILTNGSKRSLKNIPSFQRLGGGISDNIRKAEYVGKTEKTHLIINRLMRIESQNEGHEFIDVGTDYKYPFYNRYVPTLHAMKGIVENLDRCNNYPSSYGLEELRIEFVKFLRNEFNINLCQKNEVMVTSGASQAFDAVSRAFSGEYFIVPHLSLPTVTTISVGNGGKEIRAPRDQRTGFIDISELEKILKKMDHPTIRFLYFNSPCNPTGDVAPRSFFERIIELATRYNILLIHDMDSWRTVHNDIDLLNLLQFEKSFDVGISVFSVSKEFGLPGLRIGFVCGNKDVINTIRIHNSIFSVMLPEINQTAVLHALKSYNSLSQSHRRNINNEITEIVMFCVDEWRKLGWPEERIYIPKAGFKFLVDTPINFMSTSKFNRDELFNYYVAKYARVKLSGSSSFNPTYPHYIRMIAMQEKEVMKEVFERLRGCGVCYDMEVSPDLIDEYRNFLQRIDLDLNDF